MNERLHGVASAPLVQAEAYDAPAWPAHPAWLAQFLRVLGTRIEP